MTIFNKMELLIDAIPVEFVLSMPVFANEKEAVFLYTTDVRGGTIGGVQNVCVYDHTTDTIEKVEPSKYISEEVLASVRGLKPQSSISIDEVMDLEDEYASIYEECVSSGDCSRLDAILEKMVTDSKMRALYEDLKGHL